MTRPSTTSSSRRDKIPKYRSSSPATCDTISSELAFDLVSLRISTHTSSHNLALSEFEQKRL